MVHTVLLAAHALCGVVALAAAVVAFERPPRGLATSVTATVLMTLFLLAAVAVDWPGSSSGVRVLSAGLSILAVACVAAGVDARRVRPADRSSSGRASRWGPSRRRLGFMVVALSDAFLVILVLDLGAPAWAVAATGVVVAALGHRALRLRLDALADHSDGTPRPAEEERAADAG